MSPFVRSILLCALLVGASRAHAAVIVGVDPGANWIGYMNVFDLPENGGGYKFGQPWGTADLDAGFSGSVLTLGPNTSIARDPMVPPTDAFWWKPDGSGNKQMDANFYVEDSTTLPGQEVTFTGQVLENSLVNPYTSVAFIKDFDAGYGLANMVTVPLVNGVFSISLPTIGGAGHHIQYGFETQGPNASVSAAPGLGLVRVTAVDGAAIPEPSTLLLVASSSLGLLGLRRSRRSRA